MRSKRKTFGELKVGDVVLYYSRNFDILSPLTVILFNTREISFSSGFRINIDVDSRSDLAIIKAGTFYVWSDLELGLEECRRKLGITPEKLSDHMSVSNQEVLLKAILADENIQ